MSEVMSTVEVAIRCPLADVAELLANPVNYQKWMDDLDRCEPATGELGLPGSTFRLIPKDRRERLFVATVLTRELPAEVSLILRADDVEVTVVARMSAIDENRTKLVHNELFALKGMGDAPVPEASQNAMRGAHRHHVMALKAFAERNRE